MGRHDQSWKRHANCKGLPTYLFFPDPGPNEAATVAAAKAVCESCPVRQDCLEAGLLESRGIWGGLTTRERSLWRDAQRARTSA